MFDTVISSRKIRLHGISLDFDIGFAFQARNLGFRAPCEVERDDYSLLSSDVEYTNEIVNYRSSDPLRLLNLNGWFSIKVKPQYPYLRSCVDCDDLVWHPLPNSETRANP